MHEFEDRDLRILRRIRKEYTKIDEGTFLIGRARMERAIADSRMAKSSRRSHSGSRKRITGLAIVGAVAASVLTFVFSTATPDSLSTQAQASEMLLKAADRVLIDEVTLAPGQYLRIERETVSVWARGYMMDSDAPEGATDFSDYRQVDEADIPRQVSTTITYVPEDRQGEWVVRGSENAFLNDVLPKDWDQHFPPKKVSEIEGKPMETGTLQGGRMVDPASPDGFYPDNKMMAAYTNAPHDPVALRDHIEREIGAVDENHLEEAILDWINPILEDASYSAPLRSAAFQVLAGLGEEMGMTASVEEIAAPAGESSSQDQRGVAVQFATGIGWTHEYVFDAQGTLVETRRGKVEGSDIWPGMPSGLTIVANHFATTVVDKIPDEELQ